VDEGDISMPRCVKILKDINFDGVCIPDHTPEMLCGAPWHAGMAYALGAQKSGVFAVKGRKKSQVPQAPGIHTGPLSGNGGIMKEWNTDTELFEPVKTVLYTPVVGDILDSMGYVHQFLPQAIQPIREDFKIAGWAAVYLASGAAGFVNGATLVVDGGALIGF
jgi:hypothetical protein